MGRTADGLRLNTRDLDDVVVVTVRGLLDLAGCHRLRDHLLKIGTDAPRAVIVDLTDLRVDRPAVLAVFATTHERLSEWPGVPMLLVAGGGHVADLLARSRTGRYLPVHGTLVEALAAVDEPPPRRVARILLPNSPDSPGVARRFAYRAFAEWGVDDLTPTALLIVNELVANVVAHTGSAARVRLELRRDLLSVAVHDDVPGTVSIRDPGGDPHRLHGLLLVAQAARAWGCSPAPEGGKVVWATLQVT
ncbi:hypothetical protein LZG04_11660 [Saccharothrix sp. S26]|uniref:STAS domain-containing protein n=1 Tax=Saccharothrix sp. S26 TaxID=2907215 RepID=UPI001F213782|nr:STAS domain-containing protein [Saccharothrix sp. S26]MCE6995456.1 hypothetical protein [Saccharothrix sp. S26]